MSVNYLFLVNWDTSKSYLSPVIAPVSLLNKIGIDNAVCELARNLCNTDDPQICVEIEKETFDGDTEYSIGILALETEISEGELKDIQQLGLNFYVSLRGLFEGYTCVDLFIGSEEAAVLDPYFST